MRVINNKLILGIIAATSCINALFYFFRSSFIDNTYHISSGTGSISSIAYYFYSFFASIEYFSGAFLFLVFSFAFLANQKKFQNTSTLSFGSFTLGTLLSSVFIAYQLFPNSLGLGLKSVITTYVNSYLFFFLSLLGLIIITSSLMGLKNFISLCTSKVSLKNSFFQNIKDKNFNLQSLISKLKEKKKEEKYSNQEEVDLESFLSFHDETINSEIEISEILPKENEFFINKEKSQIDVRVNTEKANPKEPKTISKKLISRKIISGEKAVYESQDSLIGSLVSQSRINISSPDQVYFEDIMGRIEDKLKEFKIEAKVINVLKGPVVDTYEIELGPGIKVSKVTGLTEDLSLALSGAPIRMIYPIKGRTSMGIEVPRNPREIIYLDDVLKARDYKKSEKRLPIAMGKDAFGHTKVVDLASMPHMLVAGSTGAGKSVFINTLLVSLLVKLDPSKLKLILIDPKQLELALYAKLPHLLMPVMTDPKTSSLSLLWACQEMERRYTILKEMGVRNIEGFNEKLKRSSKEDVEKIKKLYKTGEPLELPYIVIIVDEFADLILSKVGKDIETNICRLAAKARASGIHLVLATQRPSVDVITGLVKSNFPTRVSFRVTSAVDSRTILNKMGAEKLLGKGDMLYKHGVEMERLHSSYVDENEIESLVEKMCTKDPEFHTGAMEFLDDMENGSSDLKLPDEVVMTQTLPEISGKDTLYDDAINLVRETRSASASFLQRRLRIGYNRAANLIEQMESDGIVGPSQGSKPRKVLI